MRKKYICEIAEKEECKKIFSKKELDAMKAAISPTQKEDLKQNLKETIAFIELQEKSLQKEDFRACDFFEEIIKGIGKRQAAILVAVGANAGIDKEKIETAQKYLCLFNI